MTDAQISEYLASMRKWPRLPSDHDATTEDIIRRYLKGEIECNMQASESTATVVG